MLSLRNPMAPAVSFLVSCISSLEMGREEGRASKPSLSLPPRLLNAFRLIHRRDPPSTPVGNAGKSGGGGQLAGKRQAVGMGRKEVPCALPQVASLLPRWQVPQTQEQAALQHHH